MDQPPKIDDLDKAIKKKKALLANIGRDRSGFVEDLKLSHTAELLRVNLDRIKIGAPEVSLWDYAADPPKQVRVQLDVRLKPKEQLEALFRRIKRAKRGIAHIEERLEILNRELIDLENLRAHVLTVDEDEQVLVAEEKPKLAPKKKPQRRLPYREYISSDGIKIWVGRSARDGDELTLKHTRGNDWWFHTRDIQGAHVVVKHPKEALPPATFLEAAMLAAHFSKAKDEGSATVSYTQVKNVKKPKGFKPGLVTLTHERTVEIRMDQAMLNALLDRSDKNL